jgi:GGDEF domain-containing protein
MTNVVIDNKLSPFVAKPGTAAPELVKRFNELAGKIERGNGRKVTSFESNFELYLPIVQSAGEVFSFHTVSIPGFVQSLNDSFLVYGLGDNFIVDVAALIEKHFTSQGKICKVFAEGVNLIVCLEGKTPADMDKIIGDVLKKGDFKYDVNLWNIPNTDEGNKIKAKIIKWANKYKVPNNNGIIKVDVKTFDLLINGISIKGVPRPRVGSFDLDIGEDYTPRQLKTKIIKLLLWVKFGRGNGKIDFSDKRLSGTQVDELVNIRDFIEFKNIPSVVSDFSKNPEIFDKALELTPEEFSNIAKNETISDDSREFLKVINESNFMDFKYKVLNESALESLIQQLTSAKEDFFLLSGDITNLGGVNNEYGRLVGDGFLEKYLETWKELAEKYSESGIRIDIFRSGADEYGLIIQGTRKAEDVRSILKDFNSRVNNKTITIPEKYLTKEEKALLKNKGIGPKDGKVEILISDLYRKYLKYSTGRFDVGASQTIFGDHVTKQNKRSGETENQRVKSHAKEEKKGADGKSYAKIKDTKNREFIVVKDVFNERKFSSKKIEVKFYSDYLAAGAPQSGIPGKALSIGYNGATSALGFTGAEMAWGLGERTIEVIKGEEVNWDKFGEGVASATKGGIRYGALEGTFRSFWNLNRGAMPSTLALMTVNDLAGTPEAYRGLALTQGVAGLGSFMGAMQASEMGISTMFGYSIKTPGPWWIKVSAFGLAYASSKGAGIGINELYVHNQGFKSFVDSDLVKGSANVLKETAKPADVAFTAYTGTKALNLVGAKFIAARGLTSIGSKAIPVVGWVSAGSYAIIGGAEHFILSPYMRSVLSRAKDQWKEANKDNLLSKISLEVGDFLTGPFIDNVTPDKYIDGIIESDRRTEAAFMEYLGQATLKAAIYNDTYLKGTKGSAMPRADQFKPELKQQLKQIISQWISQNGIENFTGVQTLLQQKYGDISYDGIYDPLTKLNVNDIEHIEISDQLIDLLFINATSGGKSIAVKLIESRKPKK